MAKSHTMKSFTLYCKKYINHPFRTVKVIHQKIFNIKDAPENIARGFALGSFIGMTPFIGLHLILSVGIASLLKWNKIAAGIAVFNTNLLTGVFIFSFNYYLGSLFMGGNSDFTFPDQLNISFVIKMMYSGSDVFMALILGGIITGIPTAFISYKLIKTIIYKQNLKQQIQ